ncbi:very short patch repair endonuclease [Naumannella sp. ID2617S]|nr:very short patch repair endonuclease [Naumannella sp. ID2617S]
MPPSSWASSANSRATMRANRGRDTEPELLVRRLLHAAGYRYRVNERVPGMARRTIDIAFARKRVAIFIDGCFWHGCPDHYNRPKANAEFWRDKREQNMRRDDETTKHLQSLGWTVLRFWTHEPADQVAQAVRAALERTDHANS